MLNLNKLEQKLEKALLGETKESIQKFLCHQQGLKACKETCPVYEAEQCPNQLINEIFFKWLEENGKV